MIAIAITGRIAQRFFSEFQLKESSIVMSKQISLNWQVKVLFLMGAFVALPARGEDELPVRAKVLVEEMEDYRRDISKKAQDLIETKLTKVKQGLEAELNRQIKAGNAPAARAILAVVEKWNAEQEKTQQQQAVNSDWEPLFHGVSLPKSWTIAKEADGGWDYASGTLEIQSVLKGAVLLHNAEPGNIVLRGEVQVINDGNPREDHRVGIGFIDSKERTAIAYTHAPGTIFVHSAMQPGDGLLGHEKSSACQKKFSELQVAWVGTRFMVFAAGKLLIDQDIGSPRGGDDIALLATNASGLFRNVGFRVPDGEDLKRLNSRKPLK
jgi:hypothetical protein